MAKSYLIVADRYFCDVLEGLRRSIKINIPIVKKQQLLLSLIEELQEYGNRMESALYEKQGLCPVQLKEIIKKLDLERQWAKFDKDNANFAKDKATRLLDKKELAVKKAELKLEKLKDSIDILGGKKDKLIKATQKKTKFKKDIES